jgi:toxin FitB
LREERRSLGHDPSNKGFPTPDGYIAAIAAAHDFAAASRDVSAFAAAGLTVIAPWTAAV